MKSLPALLTAFSATLSISSAASIIVDNLADTNFVSPIGRIPLGTSFIAKVGFLAEGAILSPSADFATINAAWTSAGQNTFATGGTALGFNGYFEVFAAFSNDSMLAGRDVYVWITNGGEQNAVLRSLDVNFLADFDIPNMNFAQISSDKISNFEFILGSYDPNGVNEAGSGGSIVLVPEPSAFLLGALGAVGLIRRRRA